MMRMSSLCKALGCVSRLSSASAAVSVASASGSLQTGLLQGVSSSAAITPAWATASTLAKSRGMSSVAATAAKTAAVQPKMFCYQCEQTANGTGCTTVGQCGKTAEVAGLQDLLMYSVKGLGVMANHARTQGVTDAEVDSFILRAIFSTLTNVNFHDERFQQMINESVRLQTKLVSKLAAAKKPINPAPVGGNVNWFLSMPQPVEWNATMATAGEHGIAELMEISPKTGIAARQELLGKTTAGLQELIMYGLKGMCAYAAHAEALGAKDANVHAFVQKSLTFLCSPDAADVGKLLGHAMELGTCNFRVMQLLSEAHISSFGSPTPTEVSLSPVNGKAILITGHDMHDLELLLQQTEGKGINVYTHGEMLPAHGYPGLKKYKHLVGHYGGAWYQQKMDFSYFPGSILVTTNCVLDPMTTYKKNIFTTNETGIGAGAGHLGDKNYAPLIQRALELPGFTDKSMRPRGADGAAKKVTVGFGHDVVLSVAGQVIDAIKEKKLSHIFLIGGCDGHEPQRVYYNKLAQVLPKDTMVLTLGCGKFRIFDQPFGNLPGTALPRLLDMGQCNDAYSALVVATELSKAFNCSVNELPLSLDISWFEQKAVSVLLTLLSLGVKNIRLGPVLPAFLTADAVQVLVDKFELKAADTSNPDQDLLKMLANK